MAEKIVKDSQGLAKELVNDCISRKAAIEKATKDHDFFRGATTPTDKARRDELLNVICWLGELPSAQPQKRTQERTETHACDCISRKAAIDAIVNTVSEIGLHDNSEVARYGATFRQHEIIDIIEGMPSAQPERKRGKWIYSEDEYGVDGYHCDECGFFVPWDYVHKFINYIEDYNFCPNCGADMREVNHETD